MSHVVSKGDTHMSHGVRVIHESWSKGDTHMAHGVRVIHGSRSKGDT